MVIGAFAGAFYGIQRVTYDIDIVVDLGEEHIRALVAAFPSPRYYADADQMRDSIRMGIMFNIIDSSRGEKADLVPLSMAQAYRRAFQYRIRQNIHIPGAEPFEIWVARPEDIIIGKLTAWVEGRSRKHETDIYEMMTANELQSSAYRADIDETYIESAVRALGEDAIQLWQAVRQAAQREARGNEPQK
jgi:hypothetical protein